MDRIKSKWLLILSGLCFIIAAWVFWSAFFNSEPEKLSPKMPVEIYLQDIELLQGKQGQKHWELTADNSKYFKNESKIEFTDPKLVFYSNNRTDAVHVQAPRGSYKQDENKARLWPEVRAIYQNATLSAKRMDFNAQNNKLYFKGNVRVIRPDFSVISQEAEFDLDKSTVTCIGDVEAIIHAQF